MNSNQVATELNLSLSEFQKIEESIASILGLTRDSEGNFEYSMSDLGSLKEVFLDQNTISNKQDGLSEDSSTQESEQWKQNMSETLDTGAPSKISLTSTDPSSAWWSDEFSKGANISDSTKSALVDPVQMNEQVVAPPVHKARVHTPRDTRLRIPGFERLRRDESGEIRLADYDQAWNPPSKKNEGFTGSINRQFNPPYPSSSDVKDPITERSAATNAEGSLVNSQEDIEKRLRDLEINDSQHLREENLLIKKENLALRKEIQTLENIIRNQDHDRMYLVQRLNEKFTLRRLLQWKLGGEDAFSGHSVND